MWTSQPHSSIQGLQGIEPIKCEKCGRAFAQTKERFQARAHIYIESALRFFKD